MAVLKSSISPRSDSFKANVAAHEAAMAPVQEAAAKAIAGGGEKSRDRHLSRGKILPRDRVARLLDPGSPFMEIGMYDGVSPPGGAVAGIGRVAGRDDRVQRCHCQRRHLFSRDGEKTPARARDRDAKPFALCLSRGFRRGELTQPRRGLTRP